jgi:hypothetical protein
MNFFNLPHLFVVFPAGGSGNFLSQLIKKLIDNDISPVMFSNSGNAHPASMKILPNNEIFACGIRYGVNNLFTLDEKINFYKEKINALYSNETRPSVGWTHDYSNISLYKHLYPNCKILVITQWTDKEKLAILVQQELKNRLDPAGFVFVDDTLYKYLWTIKITEILKNRFDFTDDVISNIIANKNNPVYFPLVAYITIRMSMGLYQYNIDTKLDLLNYCLQHRCDADKKFDPKAIYETWYCLGSHYEECITEDCVQMPYSVILNNDTASLISVLEKLFNKKIIEPEASYIDFVLTSYCNKQDSQLMIDPYSYLKKLEMDCMKSVKNLKT